MASSPSPIFLAFFGRWAAEARKYCLHPILLHLIRASRKVISPPAFIQFPLRFPNKLRQRSWFAGYNRLFGFYSRRVNWIRSVCLSVRLCFPSFSVDFSSCGDLFVLYFLLEFCANAVRLEMDEWMLRMDGWQKRSLLNNSPLKKCIFDKMIKRIVVFKKIWKTLKFFKNVLKKCEKFYKLIFFKKPKIGEPAQSMPPKCWKRRNCRCYPA